MRNRAKKRRGRKKKYNISSKIALPVIMTHSEPIFSYKMPNRSDLSASISYCESMYPSNVSID